MPGALTQRVLLIGWDAADWKHINPLLARGWLPNLQRLLERGAAGNLATLTPILSPMLWNSIATGKRPHKHGILGFIEPAPDGQGVRPYASTSRRCKALWNIVSQVGRSASVIAWFCGHPAEPINGLCVTEMFQKVGRRGGGALPSSRADWVLPEDCVHPADLRETVAALRMHPAEVDARDILPFIPHAARIDQQRDRRLEMFAKLFAEMNSVHAAALYALEQHPADLTAIYYDSVDHFCHGFMRYHPPRMESVSEEDFALYRDVISGVYRYHDLMLGELLARAGADTTVVLCSDHGFHCDHLRPGNIPRQPAGPAVWHREYGIVCLAGPGVQAGVRIEGASLLDITPTVLTLLGLPSGADMDGKPLVQALDARTRPFGQAWFETIPSWEAVAGPSGMHPAARQSDPLAEQAAVQQLVDLGYIEAPGRDSRKAAENAECEARYNLARSLLSAGLAAEAGVHLRALVAQCPDELRYRLHLAQGLLAERDHDVARRAAEELLARAGRQQQARAALAERQAAHLAAHETQILAEAARDRPDEPLTAEDLARAQGAWRDAAARLRSLDVGVTPQARLLLGTIELAAGRPGVALEHLLAAEASAADQPVLQLRLGQAYLRMRRDEDAARAFRRVLDLDPDSASGHEGLAAALSRQGQAEAAVTHALRAVELLHTMPSAHLRLGITLYQLGLYDEAIRALETTLKLAPQTARAHRWLGRIYSRHRPDPQRAVEHQVAANQILRGRSRR